MQEQIKIEKYTNCITNKTWLFALMLGIGLAVALLLMYLPVYFANDELFSELDITEQNQECVTESNKSITKDRYDPNFLYIVKEVPIRSTEKGITYVEKGFSRFASSLPWWSLALIILYAFILFILVTCFVLYLGTVTYTDQQMEHKMYPYLRYEVLLFIVSFILLMAPCFRIFSLNGATTAIAGFYAGLFTWCFHLLLCPYNIQFKIPLKGQIDIEKCKMMSEYYSKLLSFVLGIFSAVTIGLVWYVSQLLAKTSVQFPKLLRHQLIFLFIHDIYASTWLLLFISKHLAWNYFQIVSRCKVTTYKK